MVHLLDEKALKEYSDEQLRDVHRKLKAMTGIMGAGPESNGQRTMRDIEAELQRRVNLRRVGRVRITEERR